MSQLNNNVDNGAKVEGNIKKSNSFNKRLIVFVIIFTILCVSITAVLIYLNNKNNNIQEKIASGETVINETGNVIENDNVPGIQSLDETYKMNELNISKVVYENKEDNKKSISVSYVQIDGLANEELENKINEKIKTEVLNNYEDPSNYLYYYLTGECTANFGNVLSIKIHKSCDSGSNYEEYNSGLNIDLTTGNEIKFNDLFTYNAGIKNILSESAYDSLLEKYTSNDGASIDDTPIYTATDDEKMFYAETTKEMEQREERYGEIEDIVFKLMTKFNNGKDLEFSFSSRCIYVYENNYTVRIKMKKYYNQIAIYNRFNNASNLYDGNYKNWDSIENNDIPVFVSVGDNNSNIDVDIGSDPIYLRYFNVKKESDNFIFSINLISGAGDFEDFNENTLAIIKDEVEKKIEEYKNINDGNKRFVQISINGNTTYGSIGYETSIYSVKDSDNFISDTLEAFQNGEYRIYWTPEDRADQNIWKDFVNNYKEISYTNTEYEYNKATKKWTEKIRNQISPPEVNPNNQNTNISKNGKTIVIDPGHQAKANSQKEPIGPGATETKAKVTDGATGVATGQTEYSLNLKVSLKLKDALESKGYNVIMTRTTNDVDISNSERAQIANNANADAFIRIHANSADSSSAKGVLTMCQTSSNKFNGDLADRSYKLSKSIVDKIASKTGTQNRGVTRTDEMSGINWCTVPSTIVEMGFLSNSEEDRLMADDSYQDKIVNGIVEGLEDYLS